MSAILSKVKNIFGLDNFDEDNNKEDEIENEMDYTSQNEINKRNSKVVKFQAHSNPKLKLAVYEPEKYDEVTKIVEDLKVKKLVILNLEKTEAEIKKQIFDFVNGAIYALDGTIQKASKALKKQLKSEGKKVQLSVWKDFEIDEIEQIEVESEKDIGTTFKIYFKT